MDFAEDDIEIVPAASITAKSPPSIARLLEALAATFATRSLLRNGAASPSSAAPTPARARSSTACWRATAPSSRHPRYHPRHAGRVARAGRHPVAAHRYRRAAPHGADEAEQHGIARTHEALADADLILLVRRYADALARRDALTASLADARTSSSTTRSTCLPTIRAHVSA